MKAPVRPTGTLFACQWFRLREGFVYAAAMPFQLPSYKISIKLVQLALEKATKNIALLQVIKDRSHR